MPLRKWFAVLCVLIVLVSVVAGSFALPHTHFARRADLESRVMITSDAGLLWGTDSPQCPSNGGGGGCI